MKCWKWMILSAGLLIGLAGCGSGEGAASHETPTVATLSNSAEASKPAPKGQQERKLRLTVDGKTVMITLYDTPAARALYERLPLELTFEDFNQIEKISYLSSKLPTEGEPDSCDPDVGDFCLYAPWGNLSIFYKDFRVSKGLIRLGHIDSGLEEIAHQNENFSVTLEAVQ